MGDIISLSMTAFVDHIVAPVTGAIVFAVENGLAFVIFALMWIGFGYAVVASQGSLDATWQWIRSLPLIIQGVVWLLFLPVVIALWVWETTWPIVMRVVVIGGLAWWSLLMFVPKWLQAARP